MTMNNIIQTSENDNYTAINIGSLDNLAEHKLVHPFLRELSKGKLLLKM